ncbi:urease accessory protein UreD [Saccharolobus caldissimus]|uniref:Urease accessory protein UreH n=1 Tax=Saccharolobus caldissimus TaxID=1702097 RepID=A0AAQ4CS83_9CREN|nr:urease accessory protein UreD [Saccharolobus caldissimus]BDB98664.1 hypothetical protein SACC_16810 [Saccharolobus caldissimus]
MRAYLKVDAFSGWIKVIRRGQLNAYKINDIIIIANPSEVLAHDDELTINVSGENFTLTDQSYTKILTNSNVKVEVNVNAKRLFYYPHPIIFYNKSNASIRTTINVIEYGKIVEGFILGRGGHNEDFTEGNVKAVTEIYNGDSLLIYDVFRIRNENYKSPNVMGKPGIISVFEIKSKEYDFERYLVSYRDLDRKWRDITGIWY